MKYYIVLPFAKMKMECYLNDKNHLERMQLVVTSLGYENIGYTIN